MVNNDLSCLTFWFMSVLSPTRKLGHLVLHLLGVALPTNLHFRDATRHIIVEEVTELFIINKAISVHITVVHDLYQKLGLCW